MFRKTTITITLAAAAFVAIGSSAPAGAHSVDCFWQPAHCLLDTVTPDRDRGPVEEEPTLDTSDIIDAIGGGGLLFPIPTGPTLTPGGVSADPGTVIAPELPDDVLDAITGPTVESPPIELPPLVDPGSSETPEPPAETPEAPESTEPPAEAPEASVSQDTPPATPDTGSSGRGAAVAPAHTEAPAPVAPQTVVPRRTAPAAPERVTRQTTSTTLVAAQDDATQNQTDDSVESVESVEALVATDGGSTVDPMMAAALGMLGVVALMLLVSGAFAAGRRRN
ncbi:MAG: hypothetical protein M3112_09985 [Actinomycetia bacterium]|nr:hypothetical protein [Actinomycetes bacterium]